MSIVRQRANLEQFVGAQIRQARRAHKLTQEQVGEALGLTFQQVQKFEMGVNRVSAGQLLQFSKLFELPLTDFFPRTQTGSTAANAMDCQNSQKLRQSITAIVTEISDLNDLRAIEKLAQSFVS